MNKFCLLLVFCIITFIACNKPVNRKVLVMAHGKLKVKENNITVKDGAGYIEKLVDVEGLEPAVFNIKTPTGKREITIPEERGFYILNLKADTLVGSSQILGVDISNGQTITQEELKIKIDSLTKLTTGDNIEFGQRNYFILPGQLIKITSNIEAKVFGPYKLISRELESDQYGNLPEIYKFYTNTEMRQLISNFKKMTY